MLKEMVTEYALPIAVTLSIAIGSMSIKNTVDVAVVKAETANMVEVQKEMNSQLQEISKVVYRIDGKLEN